MKLAVLKRGKHATGVKRGKACNRLHIIQAPCAKRGEKVAYGNYRKRHVSHVSQLKTVFFPFRLSEKTATALVY